MTALGNPHWRSAIAGAVIDADARCRPSSIGELAVATFDGLLGLERSLLPALPGHHDTRGLEGVL